MCQTDLFTFTDALEKLHEDRAKICAETGQESIVRPKCGRMVSFNSRNPHGVLPVFSGRRCAVLVWMTHTKERQEAIRVEIENILGYSVANSSHRYV
ncbi:hypothetical protein MTO96_044222 [Rhipicephalus appendiculatus]